MSTCFTYDVEKQIWNEIAGLPSRKYAGTNMMLDNHYYFFGGLDYYFEQTTFDYSSYEFLPMIDGTYYLFYRDGARSENLGWEVVMRRATHSANFNEKVHKPQSKSYSSIGVNMQLVFTYIL